MFAIQIQHLDLEKIKGSMQTFRWIKVHKYKYVIIYKDKITLVEQSRDWLKLTCTEEEFYNVWYNYFDMGYDYEKQYIKLRSKDEELKKVAVVSKGLRILNMDIFECMLINILLEHENSSTVKLLLQNICRTCGKEHKNRLDGMEIHWYEVPTPTQILENKDKLSISKIGIALEEILSLCMFIENGTLDLESEISCKERMMQIKELGLCNVNTAKSICLYGFGFKEALPMTNKLDEIMYLYDIDVSELPSETKGLSGKQVLHYGMHVEKFEKNFQEKYLQTEIYGL